ncbi:BatD family protein [Spirosoma validum]|uniref:BatD family protein n=1 Tax=Spirosoma validum TaxID=2771355 RepID=UPI00293BB4FB|nr:BatD family protein [Spirosoma validum]
MTSIEVSQTDFPIERPFTISVIIPNSETRPAINFPDIVGFTKKGIVTSTTSTEINEKNVISQVITQSYQARGPGSYRLQPFSLVVDGETIYSEGATLVVRSSASNSSMPNLAQNTVNVVPEGSAFLSLRASKSAIYTGESVALTLSFFVADNYPYVLNFTALDKQLQAILKKIRPVNSWEENIAINELKPTAVTIGGKKFREFRIYQSVFFPLSNQTLQLPAVSLQLIRPRPIIGPPSAQAEKVLFTSKPLVIAVKPLPAHALRGRVPVGLFRLEEVLERPRIGIGQSVRYTFTVAGEGNIATLPAPTILNERTDMDVFPPEERHLLSHISNQVRGRKSFTYFIVPHQHGSITLTNYFQWIYFNPQTARYDTLRPHLQLQAGGRSPLAATNTTVPTATTGSREITPEASVGKSLYAGIEAMDSTRQSISISSLVRAVANVLIVIMLLGMIFVFFRK